MILPWWKRLNEKLETLSARIGNAFVAGDEARQLARKASAEASLAATLARTVRDRAETMIVSHNGLTVTVSKAIEQLVERVELLEASPHCGTCGARYDKRKRRA